MKTSVTIERSFHHRNLHQNGDFTANLHKPHLARPRIAMEETLRNLVKSGQRRHEYGFCIREKR